MAIDFSEIPSNYVINNFFERYVRSFLPPWFDMTAQNVGGASRRDFRRMWSWAFDQLMAKTRTEYDVGLFARYSFGLYGDTTLGTYSKVSDIFRTSFIRTTEWFERQGWLDESFSSEYSITSCPIDPTLWDTNCTPVPEWWPAAEPSDSEITTITEWSACERLTNISQGKFRLIAAEGAVTPCPERALTSTAFRILPFAYRVHGEQNPGAPAVAEFLGRPFWQKSPTAPRPISVFEGTFDGWLPFAHETGRAGDLEVCPLTAAIVSLNINQWQPWRGAHRPFFPAKSLIDGGRPDHDLSSWLYRDSSGAIVFQCSDWKVGSLERINTNEYMLHGQYAFVDSDWLATRLDKSKYRLAFVLTTLMKHRKDRYVEAKTVKEHRLLDFVPLII